MPRMTTAPASRRKTPAPTAPIADGNVEDRDYQTLLGAFRAAALARIGTGPVFTTDAADLFALYVDSFPAATRQHHTCSACRRFLETYGGLVTIAEDGAIEPVFWPASPEWAGLYSEPIARLRSRVRAARVTGVFLSKDTTWGQPVTGPWMHFAVTLRAALPRRSAALTPGQEMAERREDYGTVQRALADFPLPLLEQAVTLLSSEAAYRGDRVLGPAVWLRDLQKAKAAAHAAFKNHRVWRAIGTAPAGFCHPRSSVIGSVLEDLAGGMAAGDVLGRFNDKMRPSQYQRAQAAPTSGAIQQAEKLFAEMGLAPALARRYAELRDVPSSAVIWAPPVAKVAEPNPGAVFGHLTPKGEAVAATLELPTVTMTWAKFLRDVLPSARTVAARIPAGPDRFVALVTAADAEAPPILQWDRAEARNPASWYYASGIDAEIRRRVVQAGGQHADVDIRASLLWNSYTDLDLHAEGPDGHIYYAEKRRGNGWLDVDANPGGGSPYGRGTRTPVENIRWATGCAPAGHYRVWVHHYATGADPSRTPFVAELAIAGEVFSFVGETTRVGQNVELARFVYVPGQLVQRTSGLRAGTAASPASPNAWGVTAGSFVPVSAFVSSPNLWGDMPQPQHGRHVFAVLKGCRDTQQGVGRGFFTETLRSDLRPVLAVLEAYAAGASIASEGLIPACGLGFSDQAPWNLTLRVTSPGGLAHYTIDRLD